LFGSTLLFGQSDSTKWAYTGVTGLNINQIALSNWTQGGDNAIAWTLTGTFAADHKSSSWSFYNNLKLAYGRTKLGAADFRTNDNEFYLENVIAYNVGWKVDPYFSNTVRTSISEGFDYKVIPAVKIADFFDPGYITQSLGFTYHVDNFNTRMGVALQETFTNVFRNYSDDPETTNEVESFKLETGFETVTAVDYQLDENLFLSSKLRLFTRFTDLDIWDVRFDNAITAKINKFLHVSLTFLAIYEKSQSPKTQLKQALQLGINYSLF
jgi:hypothetical protein